MSLSKQQFVDGVGVILQSNPGLQSNKESLHAWYHIVSDMPHDLFAAAVFDICRNLPKTAYGINLGALIRERASALALNNAFSAEEAWGEVLDQIRRVGSYGVPSFSDEAITLAVQDIGWKNICLSDAGDSALRAHFYRTYEKVRTSKTNQAMRTADFLKKLVANKPHVLNFPESESPKLLNAKAK